MDLEARSLPVSVKTPLTNKLRDYKARRSVAPRSKAPCLDTDGSALRPRRRTWRR